MMLAAGCAGERNPEAEAAALKAARAWLVLIDSGKYDESWDEAASFFRGAVGKEDWSGQVGAVRGAMGKTVSREVKSKWYRTSLPGAPDGQYVVIQFKTSFEKKNKAIETVTPMLDEGGVWRVSGYYVK